MFVLQDTACVFITGYGLCLYYRIRPVFVLQDTACVCITGYGLCFYYRIRPVFVLQDTACVCITGYGLCLYYRIRPVFVLQDTACVCQMVQITNQFKTCPKSNCYNYLSCSPKSHEISSLYPSLHDELLLSMHESA